jgi:hypothetical protein
MQRLLSCFVFVFVFGLAAIATGQTQLQVTVETVGPVGLAPVIVNFSDGSYDIFDVGSAASDALEDLAETGSPMGFAPPSGGPVFGPGVGPGSPPIYAPAGATASEVFTVDDSHTMFQIAAMVLPSNDWFIGNDTAFDVSALIGALRGSSLKFDFSLAYDAGTEEEDFDFSPGNGLIGVSNPGGGDPDFGTDTPGEVVTLVTGSDPFASFLNIPNGFDTTTADFTSGSIASVTVTTVPEPTGLAWIVLPLLTVWRRR